MEHFSFLFSPAAEALGFTLFYSLWQAFIVFICLLLVLKLIPNASARIKYAVFYFAYVGIAVWFVITLSRQLTMAVSGFSSQQISIQNGVQQISFQQSTFASVSSLSISYLNHYLPWIVAFYLLGIVWFTVRLVYNYFLTIKLRTHGLTALESSWHERITQMAEKINIPGKVNAFFSKHIDTPMMMGFFKPIILLPLAMINRLSPQQFEAILLHELAHIRRNDYFLNLIQSVIDTVLFFNPFTWWITKNIREEREKCCDEMVLKLSDPYQYAEALLALEEPLQKQVFVLAAIGKRSQLLYRIKNIMEMKNNHINFRQKFITFLVIISASISVAWLTPDQSKAAPANPQSHVLKISFLHSEQNGSNTFSVNNFPLYQIADTAPKPITPLPPKEPLQKDFAVTTSPLPPTRALLPLPPNAAPVPVTDLPPLPPLPPLAPGIADTVSPVNNYFNSKEWKKQEEEIKKNSISMRKYFNSPEWKKQQLAIQKNAANIQKYFKSPEWKKQQEVIRNNAARMRKYFNSPEWKKQQLEIRKNAANVQKYFKSPEWKKQQEEIKHSADSITAYFKSDEWKKQQENIKKSIAESQRYFQSSEWRKQQEKLKQMMEENKEMMKDSGLKKK